MTILFAHARELATCSVHELKAVLEWADVPREADPEAINQSLHFHTPLFERTFFREEWKGSEMTSSTSTC